MSRGKPVARKLSGSSKIEPHGRVQLGTRLELEEFAPSAAEQSPFLYAVGLPDDGSIAPIDSPLPYANQGGLSLQELDYRLQETDGELCLEDRGLTSSYGIFGAPGCGKTFLMLHMLRQLLSFQGDDPERRFGALILDPKAALIEDVQAMTDAAGRTDDLVVLNAAELKRRKEAVNVIDCDLDAYELSRALVLAAQSAGVGASEPYWFGSWQNLFSAAIFLLQRLEKDVLTLRTLIDSVLTVNTPDPMLTSAPPQRYIEELASRAKKEHVPGLSADERSETLAAINQLNVFYSQKPDNIATVSNLIMQAYGEFLRARTKVFCKEISNGASRTSFYDEIIDDGKIVLVSVSPADPGLAKVLCTLVKNLFMQSMRSRLDRVREGRLHNFQRPVVLACDEYSQVASEIPGQTGDGDFFSIARQQGCMGLLATQSVNVLQSSSLKENWKAIFSNFGGKIFMRAVDNETVEEATKLAGENDWYETSLGTSSGGQGLGSSTQRTMKERKALPGHVLTQLIATGEGVFIGSSDARTRPSVQFFRVPPP
jgi:hypothetical protein